MRRVDPTAAGVLGLLLLAAVLGSCADEVEPTLLDSDEEEQIAVAAERVPPILVLNTPPRGLFATTSEIVVSGSVLKGTAPITKVTVNDTLALLEPDGRFELIVPLKPGPNILGIRAEAEDKGRAVDAVTVYGGPVREPGQTIQDAMLLHFGREFLDDDEDDLDDLSSLLALMLSDDAFLAAMTADPFVLGDDTITVTSISVSDADVDLVPQPACLAMRIVLGARAPGGSGQVHLQMTTTGLAAILGEEVTVDATRVQTDAVVCPSTTADGTLEFEIRDSDVQFEGLRLSTNDYPDLADDLPSVHSALQGLLENALVQWMGGSLGETLGSFLEAFHLNYTFAGIDVTFDLEDIALATEGMDLFMSGSFAAMPGLPGGPVPNAGSLRTDDPPLKDAFSMAPVAIALSDDAINQFLFAFWWKGSVGDYDLDPASLAGLPEVFQPVSSVDVNLLLPPTLVAPIEPEFPYDIAVGGVDLELVAGGNRRFDAGVHLRAGADLVVDEQGLLTMRVDDRAQKITVQANVSAVPEGLETGDVAALFRLMVPAALGQIEVGFGGFPLPTIDLSAFSASVAAFQGRAVKFTPSTMGKAGEGGGYFVVEGTVQETAAGATPE